MLRFLQKLKAKKGFTIIELVVVIVIIAVLMAVILPMLSTERSKVRDACSTATDFYAAVQTVMTKFSTYDAPLSAAFSAKEESNQPGIIRYYAKMGGSYPYDKTASITDHEYPAATSMYIMLYAKNDQIKTVGVVSRAKSKSSTDPGFFRLLQRNAADRSTEFGKEFIKEIEQRIRFRDGYYYARVDFIPPTNADKTINKDEISTETARVVYAAYCRKELPQATGSPSSFENGNLYFGSDYKLNSGEICGTCSALQGSTYVGLAGTKLN